RQRYPDVLPVLLTVEPALLRQRLQDRGREDAEEVSRRLERNARFCRELDEDSNGAPVLVVDNSNEVDHAIQTLYAYLKQSDASERPGLHDTFNYRHTA